MIGELAEAEPLYKRSLALMEKALGPNHPIVATSLNNLAGLYTLQGRHVDGELLHKRAISVREKALGPNHPAVGDSLNNLAGLYRRQERYAEAELLHRRDLAIGETAFGHDHPNVSTALANIGLLHFVQRNWGLAVNHLQRSVALTVQRATRSGVAATTTLGKGIVRPDEFKSACPC